MKDFTTTKETLVRGMRYAGFASMADLHARVTLRNKTMLATARQELDDHGHRLWPVLVYRGLAIYPMGHHDRRGDPQYNAVLTGVAILDATKPGGTYRVNVGNGLNSVASIGALKDGDYEPEVATWGDTVWIRPSALDTDILLWMADIADPICSLYTGFETFQDLLTAKGDYRPTICTDTPDLKRLAVMYDAAQELRGDPRRAHTHSHT
jgi:hypothetical protein